MRNPFEEPAVAAGYDAWFDTELGGLVDRLEKQLILELAQPRAGERALDVGTGTGHYAVELAGRGLEVVGLDASAAMLAVARARGAKVTWQRGQAEALPFGDGTFPLVLSVTALEFVGDPERALAEMYRVTAAGGRLVVAVLNRESTWGRMYVQNAHEPGSPFHGAHLYAPDEFVAALSRLGQPTWNSAVFFPPEWPGEGRYAGGESDKMIGITAQVSLYPLGQQDLAPAIQAVVDALAAQGLPVEVGAMSTMTYGDDEVVFAALREAFVAAAQYGGTVLAVTVSNACPLPTAQAVRDV